MVPVCNPLSVKQFLIKNRTPVLQHPNTLQIGDLKSTSKKTHFESVEAVKTKSTQIIKKHFKNRISNRVSTIEKYERTYTLNVVYRNYRGVYRKGKYPKSIKIVYTNF